MPQKQQLIYLVIVITFVLLDVTVSQLIEQLHYHTHGFYGVKLSWTTMEANIFNQGT